METRSGFFQRAGDISWVCSQPCQSVLLLPAFSLAHQGLGGWGGVDGRGCQYLQEGLVLWLPREDYQVEAHLFCFSSFL